MIERVKNDLGSEFWTVYAEMLDDIEAAGYYVNFATEEYIEIEDQDENRCIIYLGWANRTMWIENIKEVH